MRFDEDHRGRRDARGYEGAARIVALPTARGEGDALVLVSVAVDTCAQELRETTRGLQAFKFSSPMLRKFKEREREKKSPKNED